MSLNTKLTLEKPKVSEQELLDIQKFANNGLVAPANFDADDTVSKRSGATALLLQSNYSVRDELMSSITQSKAASILNKRPTTSKLMKDAQDALVYKMS